MLYRDLWRWTEFLGVVAGGVLLYFACVAF